MNKIEESVEKFAKPIVEDLGYEFVEVKYTKSKTMGNNLTIVIYKEEGINLDDCETVSRALDEILDNEDVTNGEPYNFNVSSLGLDWQMKTDRDFERQLNKEIEVKLYAPNENGEKNFIGTLIDYDKDTISILETCKNKKEKTTTIITKIDRNKIAKACLVIDF